MKKVYQKPTMRVVLLQQHAYLLAGSYPDEIAYVPGIRKDDTNQGQSWGLPPELRQSTKKSLAQSCGGFLFFIAVGKDS